MSKIFLSYARKDSEFVLKLCKSLKSDGVDIWLDQFNIKIGQQWDDEIEDALFESSLMIIILSPNSVQSKNVLDEISYSILNNKFIIPVLYKSCEIPYKLEHLRYISFIDNFKHPFNHLLKTIELSNRKFITDSNKIREKINLANSYRNLVNTFISYFEPLML